MFNPGAKLSHRKKPYELNIPALQLSRPGIIYLGGPRCRSEGPEGCRGGRQDCRGGCFCGCRGGCQGGRLPRPSTPRLLRRMSRTLIVPALRHALACKGYSVRALGQTLSDCFPQEHFGRKSRTKVSCYFGNNFS